MSEMLSLRRHRVGWAVNTYGAVRTTRKYEPHLF